LPKKLENNRRCPRTARHPAIMPLRFSPARRANRLHPRFYLIFAL
jgi:hypothetical protein